MGEPQPLDALDMTDRTPPILSRQASSTSAPLPPSVLADPEKWVDKYGDFLFRFAFVRVRDRMVAEDLVQETFLAALKAKTEYQGDSEFRTWFTGILRHKIADYYRKHAREFQANASDEADPAIDKWFDPKGNWRNPPKDWEVNPAEVAQQREFWVVLRGCMEILPDRVGAAFNLRVVEEAECEEVCQALGVTANNLWVLLHRARARLRACLEEKWFGQQPEETTEC